MEYSHLTVVIPTTTSYIKKKTTTQDEMHALLLRDFNSTFGEYDETDILFVFWFKKKKGKWPWKHVRFNLAANSTI